MGSPPLIVHAIHHLIMGGLENGLVNLINHMPADRYRHVVLCLDYYSDFRHRIARDDVQVIALHCRPGRDPMLAIRIWKLMRKLRPAILHSRNLSGLDALMPSMLAGVRCRIHSEHGWYDVDPEGKNRKYQLLRRIHRPLVSQYVALSRDLETYLVDKINVPRNRIVRIVNGVDTDRFRAPATATEATAEVRGPVPDKSFVIGTVGRFQSIKDPMNLAAAFVHLTRDPELAKLEMRLAMVGDGLELEPVRSYLAESGVESKCWLPGARDDVPQVLGAYDLFVLPSRGEGISNTILEAMSTGLPVVATSVGGNSELVDSGNTGAIAPAADSTALADAIRPYVLDPGLARSHGVASRKRVEEHFSLQAMIRQYLHLYDGALERT